MVAWLETLGREVARGADMLDDGEVGLAANGRLEAHDIAHLQPERIGEGLHLVGLGACGLDLVGQGARLRHERIELGLLRGVRRLLQRALKRPDLLADLLLGRAQFIEPEAGRALGDISLDEAVDEGDVLAAASLGFAQGIGIGAKNRGVNHDRQPNRAPERSWIDPARRPRPDRNPHMSEP